MTKTALTVELPPQIRDEIEQTSHWTQRSIAFIVHRALLAAKGESAHIAPGERVSLTLSTDEEDSANLATKIRAIAKTRSLSEALAAAWLNTRERFFTWAAREEAIGKALRIHDPNDDLDGALRDAVAPTTPVVRLLELACSDYPKVRALVAAHPGTPLKVLTQLSKDREPTVRKAASRLAFATA